MPPVYHYVRLVIIVRKYSLECGLAIVLVFPFIGVNIYRFTFVGPDDNIGVRIAYCPVLIGEYFDKGSERFFTILIIVEINEPPVNRVVAKQFCVAYFIEAGYSVLLRNRGEPVNAVHIAVNKQVG